VHRDESVNGRLPARLDRVKVDHFIFEREKIQPNTLNGREAIGSDASRESRKSCQILEEECIGSVDQVDGFEVSASSLGGAF
jgi:hypothetical protein